MFLKLARGKGKVLHGEWMRAEVTALITHHDYITMKVTVLSLVPAGENIKCYFSRKAVWCVMAKRQYSFSYLIFFLPMSSIYLCLTFTEGHIVRKQ